MLNIPQLFNTHGITPKGVIHIGAHEGQELKTYVAMGFKTILMIEADPDTFNALQQTVMRSGIDPSQVRGHTVNVAIADHDGHATFYRTNNSQSNSLLRLKDHKQVYPQIYETEHVRVPCRRLDTLLRELNIDPANFNYLHMDIQGGEMRALLGATNALNYIEAITAEVNLKELYEGCTLLPEFEEWLDGGGRRYQRQDQVVGGDGWGDAFYVRRPFVQMSCIGNLGRFGNACFQMLFGLFKSGTQGVDFRTDWNGAGVFEFPHRPARYPCLLGVPFRYEDTHQIAKSDHAALDQQGKDIAGFYQFHTSFYRPWKDKIRDIFRLRSRNTIPSPLAVAHLRWGDDYSATPQKAPFFQTPPKVLGEWMKMVEGKMFQNCSAFCVTPATYIATDADISISDRWYVPTEPQRIDLNNQDLLAYDFDMMVNANYLLVSNSSLSMFAALLNRNFDGDGWRGHCFRPVPKLGPGKVVESVSIEEFDPWNAEVLLGK